MCKILIVEDEFLIAEELSIILNNFGFKTISGIDSYDSALRVLQDERISLVLLDINLNDSIKDGICLGKYLLEYDSIPYIYITSQSDLLTINRVNESRPHGIIIKPFKPEDIISTVSVVLNNFSHRKIELNRIETKNDITDVPLRLKKVIDYINNHLNEKISMNDLAKVANWSQPHFIKMFGLYLDSTPYQYIMNARIESAISYMKTSDLPISHIAADLGFSSYSNFCSLFKRQIGYTPNDYKKLLKINNKH